MVQRPDWSVLEIDGMCDIIPPLGFSPLLNIHPHNPIKMSKPAGLSFNRYAAIAGRVLRKALKEDKRVAAQRADALDMKAAVWKQGQQGESHPLQVPLKE